MPDVLDEVTAAETRSISGFSRRRPPTTVVLVEPRFFDRTYEINPHMHGVVDRNNAKKQWRQLRAVYERLLDDVRVMDPAETYRSLPRRSVAPQPVDRPDMVFVANHALPTPNGEEFVLSRMSTTERSHEPKYFETWARNQGYRVHDPPAAAFEGMGDALWHPGRELLWGGYGIRTERGAYEELAARLDVPVVPLELVDERYYHLDVCMAPLSESTVLIQPEAFTVAGRAKIEALFDRVLTAPPSEASDTLAVNMEVIDGTVITGTDTPETTATLEDAGFEVVSVDTSEFLKAGGSVCCLSLFAGASG